MPGERLARMASFFAVIPEPPQAEPGIRGSGSDVLLFDVIPGPPQAEPGIQSHLRGARLDPGSALRAVRDDVKRKRARWHDVERRGCPG